MLYLILAFAGGLIVGWNFLPQPKFIADIFGKKSDEE